PALRRDLAHVRTRRGVRAGGLPDPARAGRRTPGRARRRRGHRAAPERLRRARARSRAVRDRPPGRGPGDPRLRPPLARRARAAGRARSRPRGGGRAGARKPSELRRALPRGDRRPDGGRAASARPDRRRDRRRRRHGRLRPDPPGARAAHPPGEGDLEHLHEPDPHGDRGDRVPRVARTPGPGRARPAVRGQGGVRGRASHRDPRRGAAVPRRAVLQGVRPPTAQARLDGPRRARGPRVPGRSSAPGRGRSRTARRGHRASLARRDRVVRRGDARGARVTGAPVRTQDPPTSVGTIMDLSRPGRRAFSLPRLDVPPVELPGELARRTPPVLPEVAEREIVSHYTRLSQRNYGVDTGVYPLGSCSMKYNPKVAEVAAALPGFRRLHPLQPDHTVQGALELLWRLERALCEITGMERATLQPPAGACGELTGLLLMRAHHTRQGNPRRRVAIPDSAHGTNPASVRLAGYEALHIPSDARGLVDVSALEKLLDQDVAGLMLTNPNTLGLFEEEIEKIAAAVHGVGGLVYYDGANLNAILGRCRPGDMGFDIVHINTHKTFATPHGG